MAPSALPRDRQRSRINLSRAPIITSTLTELELYQIDSCGCCFKRAFVRRARASFTPNTLPSNTINFSRGAEEGHTSIKPRGGAVSAKTTPLATQSFARQSNRGAGFVIKGYASSSRSVFTRTLNKLRLK